MIVNADKELQRLYQKSMFQSSELQQLDYEIKFLKRLVEKIPGETKPHHESRVKLIHSHLIQLGMVKGNVTTEHLVHQGNLFSRIKGMVSKSMDFLKLEDSRIEDELIYIEKVLKNVRKEVIGLYRHIEASDEELPEPMKAIVMN